MDLLCGRYRTWRVAHLEDEGHGRRTRLPVVTVIENLEDFSIDEVIEPFDVTREQLTAVLDFVAKSLRADPVPTGAHPL
jgi:hypothetical protein